MTVHDQMQISVKKKIDFKKFFFSHVHSRKFVKTQPLKIFAVKKEYRMKMRRDYEIRGRVLIGGAFDLAAQPGVS